MNLFERIKYDLWPFLKTRLYLWWWTIKYGGKKNIPKEVFFAQMAKSMERLNQNLQCARASAMDDSDIKKSEMDEIYDVIRKVEKLQDGVEEMQKNGVTKDGI